MYLLLCSVLSAIIRIVYNATKDGENMNMMQIMSNIIMFFTLALYLYLNFQRESSKINTKMRKSFPIVLYFIHVLPFLLIAVFPLPLPFFYMILYVVSYLSIQILYKKRKEKWLLVNIYFLAFATPHLITLGGIALFTGMRIPELLEDTVFRAIVLIITLCIGIAINSAIRQFFSKSAIHFLGLESEEFQLFSSFVWFCAIFVILDSIPCMSDLPISLSGLFMIGSNALLLLMLYLFARHIYTIAHNSYVKDELEYMKKEEAKQHNRTKQWEEKAYLDTLTGAYTRIYAISNITAMLQNQEVFSIAFLDLDNLKIVNDDQGHMQGDLYLKNFVKHMKAYLRPNDVLSRIGGDEFLVIMPEQSYEKAERMIRTCREAGKETTPFSFGVVCVPKESTIGAEEWIAEADRLMYEDKQLRKQKGGGM